MKNKVLSLILALLMAASSASAVLADEAIADVDVEETAVVEEVAEAGQYDKAIAFLANYGIFKGISADDLGADLDVNRYQMALFVGRISTGWVDDSKWEDGPENWSEFTDISEGAVADYWGALSYANQKGIIEGYGNGKFGPYDGITYQNALTMVVRTLGYTGLDWPWGYIQKAVELGLTDGITDVAYTDELTRGETAQIIYNAMFAKTKAGSTLGLENFGVAFGWEKIIVTASDLNIFTKDAKDAEPALKDEIYAKYDKSNKTDYGTGLVAFQILNDDGTLADDVYYVPATELGLVGDHADELAVGDAYYVLFEQDEDDNLVKVVAYESLYTETIVNAGKTDDEGEEVDYAIEAWLDEHTLVNKYSNNSYVNVTASGKDEVMVFTANNSTLKVVTGTDYAIAIDWATGDILVPVDKNGDGDWKDDWKDYADNDPKNDYTKIKFEVKYSWNDTLKSYYEVEFKRNVKDIDNFEDIAINWISESEMEDLLAKYKVEFTKDVYGFNNAADARLAKSAYASLKLFDTNLDGEAERGIYETYRLGTFKHEAYDCGCGCGKLDHYVFADVDTIGKAKAASEAKNDGVNKIDLAGTTALLEEGIKCKHDKVRGWIVDDSELVLAVDEDGEETGYYAPAYVIYNVDKETGAIKVVKNITAGDDEDSYVATGVVRAYNVNKGIVTIGEDDLSFNAYSELLGNGFQYATDSAAAKAVYSTLLRSLFNQFVKYVVVDGELVHIEAVGKDTNDVIVVESYAGLSADGYIVVNGYSTSDLKYDQFRIGSYDGWMKGDYYYYLTDAKAEESFNTGAVYLIASYDEEEDLYFVNLAGEFDVRDSDREDNNGNTIWERIYTVDKNGIVTLDQTKLVAENDGYLVKYTSYDKKDLEYKTEKAIKMDKNDKYIIVPEEYISSKRYASIIVYEGKLPAGTEIEGDVIKYKDEAGDTYVFVNAETNLNYDKYDAGVVVLLRDAFSSADYNGTYAEDDRYLLGAVEYEVSVVDLLTGALDVTKYATNKDYDKGLVYNTQGDVLTNPENGMKVYNGQGIVNDVEDAYTKDTYIANTIADALDAVNLYNSKNGANKKALEGIILADEFTVGKDADGNPIYNWNGSTKVRGDKVDGITYRVIEIDEDGYVTDINDKVAADDKNENLAKFADKNDMKAIPAFYIYNVEKETAVVYLVASHATVETTTEELAWTDATTIYSWTDASITAQLGYTVTKIDGEVAAFNVDGVKLAFTGEAASNATVHSKIANKGYAFGLADEHYAEKYTVETNVWTAAKDWISDLVYTSIVDGEYLMADGKTDCDDCDLVKSIYVKFASPVVVAVKEDADVDAQFNIDIAGKEDNGFILKAILDANWSITKYANGDVKEVKLVVTKDDSDATDKNYFESPVYDVHAAIVEDDVVVNP